MNQAEGSEDWNKKILWTELGRVRKTLTSLKVRRGPIDDNGNKRTVDVVWERDIEIYVQSSK